MAFVALNNDEKELNETKNILEYTLFLDLENRTISSNPEEIINGIFDETNEVCNEFSIPDDIFGTATETPPLNKCRYDKKIISLLLRNHCIISALNTSKLLLLNRMNTNISPYRIARYLCELGFFELSNIYNFQVININDNDKVKIEYKKRQEENVSSVFDTIGFNIKANNFLQSANKYKDLIDINNYTKKVIMHSSGHYGNEFYSNLMNSDLYYNIVKYSRIINKRLDNMKTKDQVTSKDSIDFNKVLLDFVKIMRDSSEYVKTNKADKLLYKYQLERYFPYLLLHETVRNHNKVSMKYSVSGDMYYSTIAKFNMLPNAFSRSYFINWAYNSIDNSHLHENYWNHMKYNRKAIVNALTDITFDNTDRINTWMTLVNDFIYYASFVTFPIYEKTFFIKLYEFYKNKSPGKALDLMTKALITYIEENYDFLTYDFGDGELMDQYITYKVAHLKPSDYGYDGSSASKLSTDAYIKYFAKNYRECDFADIKEKDNHNTAKDSINLLQKPIDLSSLNSSKCFYELCRNIFSISDLEDYHKRTFNKEYFRTSMKKSHNIKNFDMINHVQKLPSYNYNFAFNQIHEIIKIQKYRDININQ